MRTSKLSLFFLIILGFNLGCSKSTYEPKVNLSPADILFNQVKNDTDFIRFMASIDKSSHRAMQNAKLHPRPLSDKREDSLFMSSKTITLQEKYKKMRYDGYEDAIRSIKEDYENYLVLAKKYKLWGNLDETEQKKFITISNQYYSRLLKKGEKLNI